MGLFDYVLVEHPIEGVDDPTKIEWQTKTFDCPYMDRYRITREGRLLEEVVRYEDHSDKNAEPGTFASIIGCMTRIHEGWKDTDYHGDVTFVGHKANDYLAGERLEIVARFTEGTLSRITRRANELQGTP